MKWRGIHRSTRTKRAGIMRILSSSLPEWATHFSDGMHVVSRACPPLWGRYAALTRWKTCNQFIGKGQPTRGVLGQVLVPHVRVGLLRVKEDIDLLLHRGLLSVWDPQCRGCRLRTLHDRRPTPGWHPLPTRHRRGVGRRQSKGSQKCRTSGTAGREGTEAGGPSARRVCGRTAVRRGRHPGGRDPDACPRARRAQETCTAANTSCRARTVRARGSKPLQDSLAEGTLVAGTPRPHDTVCRGPTLYPPGEATRWLLLPHHPCCA